MKLFKIHKGKKAHCPVCNPEGYRQYLREKKKAKKKAESEGK
jgi:hypothetical protein